MVHYRIRDGEDFDAYVKRCGHQPAGLSMLNTLLDVVTKIAAAQKARIEVLEQQVKVLEERPPSVDYKGIYAAGVRYTKNQCVTHRGSLWIAKCDTLVVPDETDARDWQLCVKRGRDGKNLR